MTISNKKSANSRKLLEITKNNFNCPICKKEFKINLEAIKIDKQIYNKSGIFSHLILHGKPLHGILCYFDMNMNVRGFSAIESIEILN